MQERRNELTTRTLDREENKREQLAERHVLACSCRTEFLNAAITTQPLSVTLCGRTVFTRAVVTEQSKLEHVFLKIRTKFKQCYISNEEEYVY